MFKNYAGDETADDPTRLELEEAGITPQQLPECMRNSHPEMRITTIGELSLWGFRRNWTYWVAEGPGIPPQDAELLHEKFGTVVRVAGHCGCPSPKEWFKGFAVGNYHVDSQEGLNALAETIRTIAAKVAD